MGSLLWIDLVRCRPRYLWIYLLLIPYFLLAIIPPWYRDTLTYHLTLPKLFAAHQGYTSGDEIIFGYFPLGWHSIDPLFVFSLLRIRFSTLVWLLSGYRVQPCGNRWIHTNSWWKNSRLLDGCRVVFAAAHPNRFEPRAM